MTPTSKLIMLPSFVLFLFSFRKLGDEWSVDQDVTDELEAFTCLMYDYTREKSVDSVRNIMLKKMVGENEEPTMRSKEDLSRLPPCKRQLHSTCLESELPPCQLQKSSTGDILAPQSLRFRPGLAEDRGRYPRDGVIM